MKDGKEYSVTIADTTKTFTATDNKIVAAKVTTTTIPYDTLSTISAIAVDAQGIELATMDASTTTLDGKNVTFTVTPAAGGYTTGAQLYLAKKGDVAKAKVTIKSGEYDATGKEINNIESEETTITAVDKETVAVNGFKARVTTDSTIAKFDEAKDNTTLAVGDQGHVFLKFTNTKNEEIVASDYANYKVSSSNPNVLVMNEQNATQAAINVTGVTAGTAYLIVKDTKNKDAIVATLAITVNGARTVDSFSVDRTSVVISTANAVGTEAVKLTVKDQYKNDMAFNSDYTVKAEVLASPAGASGMTVSSAAGIVTFDAKAATKLGTYTYKLTVTDKNDAKITRSQVVTLDVKTPDTSATSGYAFEIVGLDANNTVDATITWGKAPVAKDILIKVIETKGGIKYNYATANITIKKDNVAKVEASNVSTATFAAVATNAATTATPAAAGTYVVSGSVGGKNIAPVTFIVKNDTAKATATQTKETIASGSLVSAAAISASFDVNFGSHKLLDTEYSVVSLKGVVNGVAQSSITTVTGGDTVYINEMVINVKVSGTNVQVTVPVNKTVKVVA